MQSLLPRNKKGGVVSSTVMGIGGLIIGVIVILVIVQTLTNADLFNDVTRNDIYLNITSTVVNETGVNIGNYTQTGCSANTITATNITSGLIITAGNYTITGCNIAYSGTADSYNNTAWNISSTSSYGVTSKEETATTDMKTNFTKGIDNVSSKIPTILLIVAVVFLFGALVLLIRNSRLMGVGGGSSL